MAKVSKLTSTLLPQTSKWDRTPRVPVSKCPNMLQLSMLSFPHNSHSEATGSIRKGNCLHSGTNTSSFLHRLQITTLRLLPHSPGNGRSQSDKKLHSRSKGSTTRHTIQVVARHRL